MAAFQSKPFITKRQQQQFKQSLRGRYLAAVERNSFVYVGIPVLSTLLAATYMLSFFTQIRYDKHDARVQTMSEEEALEFATQHKKRQVSMDDELKKLQGMDLDNWENVRPERPKDYVDRW